MIALLNAWRQPVNRPYLRVLASVLLLCWVSMLVSASCAMPGAWRGTASAADSTGCVPGSKHLPGHPAHPGTMARDCSLQACLDPPSTPFFPFKADQPEWPVFVLCLSWLIVCLLRPRLSRPTPRMAAPPQGRRIPLIYRFCVLLN